MFTDYSLSNVELHGWAERTLAIYSMCIVAEVRTYSYTDSLDCV